MTVSDRLAALVGHFLPWFDRSAAKEREEHTRAVVERSRKVRIDAARIIREYEAMEQELLR